MKPSEYLAIREALGLTRLGLAEMLGCNASTIKKRETGVVAITEQAAAEIEALRDGGIARGALGRAKFIRLANGLLKRAYIIIQSIGRLGTSNCECTEDDVAKIREILHREIDTACDKLKPRPNN